MTVEGADSPNFLIVGAAKGGTTSLYYWLEQHPEVYLSPIKEPCFLCYAENKPRFAVNENIVLNYDRYSTLFKGAEKFKCRGEATAIYLYHYEETIRNIKKYIHDPAALKVIMILRNPVERAFSQYMMNVRDIREPLSFEEALKVEPVRIHEGWNSDFFYLDRGFYYKQVKAYMAAFPNIRVYLFDDLLKDADSLLDDMLDFLELPKKSSININDTYNFSGRPKYSWINQLILADSTPKRLLKSWLPRRTRNRLFERIKNRVYRFNLEKESMNPATRAHLSETFRQDIDNLSGLIDRDLSAWLH